MRPNKKIIDVPAISAEGHQYRLTVELPKGGKHTAEWRKSILIDMVLRFAHFFEIITVKGVEIVIRAAKDQLYVAGKAKDVIMGLCTQAYVSVAKISVA